MGYYLDTIGIILQEVIGHREPSPLAARSCPRPADVEPLLPGIILDPVFLALPIYRLLSDSLAGFTLGSDFSSQTFGSS